LGRKTKEKALGRTPGSGQGVFGKGFFGGEVFNELDDLEALARRELQKSAEQAQAFDRAARRRAELEVQFSREVEVLHLAPMTSIGLPDRPTREPNTITGCHGEDELSVGGSGGLARSGSTEQVVVMPRNNPSGKPDQRLSDASSASHHRDSG